MAASFITTISIDISHMWLSMKYKRLKGDKKRGTISELSYSSLGGVMNRQKYIRAQAVMPHRPDGLKYNDNLQTMQWCVGVLC